VGGKVLIFVYVVVCKNKRKERVFLSLTASQLTSRYLTTNPATIFRAEFKTKYSPTIDFFN
jgi:hypothetical protein